MRGLILAGLVAIAVGGCAAASRTAEVARMQAESPVVSSTVTSVPVASSPGFDFWGTGEGAYFYHRLSADCETLVHGHGRNNAWGLWRLPLGAISEGGPEEGEHGGAVLRFDCRDGQACIEQGALRATPDRVSTHAIPFGTMQRARDFSVTIANLKVACGIDG